MQARLAFVVALVAACVGVARGSGYTSESGAPAAIGAPTTAPAVEAPAPPAVAPDPGRWVFEANPLVGWISGRRVPALVTTSVPGTPFFAAGVPGFGTTRTLFGDDSVNEGSRVGLALRAAYRPDADSRQGFEAGVLWFDRQGDEYVGRSNGGGILARPFFNRDVGLDDADVVAFPGVRAGEVRVRTASDLLGAEVLYRRPVHCVCGEADGPCGDGCGIDVLLGYRGLRYRDKVTVDQRVTTIGAGPPTDRAGVRDAFYALNVFNGAQVGVAGRLRLDNLFIDGRLTGAVGGRFSSTDVTGTTLVAQPGGGATRQVGGLLTAGREGGDESIDLAFVGELTLRVGYQITPTLAANVGYTSLYFSSVQRAGSLISTTQAAGNSDVWARALSLGVEWRY